MNELQLTTALAVDLVVLTIRDGRLCVLLIDRVSKPYRGFLALPGGFVQSEEDLPTAAMRELREETGVAQLSGHLEQLATYAAPHRDPRGRVVSVAYLALVPDLPIPSPGSQAAWHDVTQVQPDALAFDHVSILREGLERARSKLEYSPLAAAFCLDEFTITELREVYEVVWGVALDPRNFHRKITGTTGFVEPLNARTVRNGGRPAQLFSRGDAVLLHPAMLRPPPKEL